MYARTRDYADDAAKAVQVLTDYADVDGSPKYLDLLQDIANRVTRTLKIELDDVESVAGEEFVDAVEMNAPRYLSIFAEAADGVMPMPTVPIVDEDVLDVLQRQRQHIEGQANADPNNPVNNSPFPKSLTRRFEVTLMPRTKTPESVVRGVRAEHIGRLIRVRGIVTRLTQVKPRIVVATYTCDRCGYELYQEVPGNEFMPIFTCRSQQCETNRAAGKLYMQTRGSRFVKFQELKLQEMADQVPIGHVPRTMSIHVKGELTRQCSPGDVITVDGIFLPKVKTGYRAIKSGLVADTFLEAMDIRREKKTYAQYVLTQDLLEEVDEHSQDPQIYEKLSKSIAPEIFGHEDVKRALLLQMVGGITNTMKDGMKIRGDINICLMGDPGVAKSQLLKYISTVAPRGVYTTGKGSSGVGLTAAVMRDKQTNELTLEGGALVLADMGICCIDEFDKMEDGDRTAIHEVMEQQTVSIAKAGITTTLNARTSILAAANPAFGRYNVRRSMTENINLPTALLSRFDLLFLLLDEPSRQYDEHLARHVLDVHRTSQIPDIGFEAFSPDFTRAYVSQARQINPMIPPELNGFIIDAYVTLREQDAMKKAEGVGYTGARTLLGILRLSQALARLRFSPLVQQADIEEALRLMNASKSSLQDSNDRDEDQVKQDHKSAIWEIITAMEGRKRFARNERRMRKGQAPVSSVALKIDEVAEEVKRSGFTVALFNDVVADYETLNMISIAGSRLEIM